MILGGGLLGGGEGFPCCAGTGEGSVSSVWCGFAEGGGLVREIGGLSSCISPGLEWPGDGSG